jgi:plastocyanin
MFILPVLLAPVRAIAKSVTHKVIIENMVFNPSEVTVNKGDTVIWTNKDFFPHTVTAENSGFDSKSIDAGKSWKYTVKRTGSFKYKCNLHPTMFGLLVVK